MPIITPERASELTDWNQTLKAEADCLLYGHGLLAALQKYGRACITGSYYLDTMAWRDLDLYVDCTDMNSEDPFRLAYDVSAAIKPHRISYQLHENTPGLPRGIYFGIQSNVLSANTWKIDLWLIGADLYAEYITNSKKLKARINSNARLRILEIKSAVWSHPQYRSDFTSMDIYSAVLDNGVGSVDAFVHWLYSCKSIEIQL